MTIIENLLIILGSAVFCIVLFGAYYYFDRASCYDKALNYQTEVSSYSYIKNYCFVEMDGKSVNLENYRDIINIQ